MTRKAKKQITSLKLEHAPATKNTAGYNYCLSPRTTPSYIKQRLANKQRTGEAVKKTKFNLTTTTIKALKLKLV